MNAILSNIIDDITRNQQSTYRKDELLKMLNEYDRERLPSLASNGVYINPETFVVLADNGAHNLQPKEFQLLYYLMANQGKNLTRETIMRDVWGNDKYVNDRTIDVKVRNLRQKLEVKCIITNRGFGYIWK